MKRSKSINIARMRKTASPIAVSVAATTLVACGSSKEEAEVFAGVEQCINANPDMVSECQAAYEKALAKSAESGPKYRSMYDCSAEFGNSNCVPYSHNGNNWFMPAMAGFMFAQALDNNRHYYRSSPVYTSYSSHSPYYGRWTTVDGNYYGRARYGKVKVSKDAFKPAPKVTRTISRGGFGSKVSAKSSWGGSSSRGGWGG